MKTVKAPPEISWLVDEVGQEAAFYFLETSGGMRIKTARTPELSRLTELFGFPVSKAICNRFCGNDWQVPVCRVWRASILKEKGHTNNEIANRLGTTWRNVQKLLSKKPSTSRQQSLEAPLV